MARTIVDVVGKPYGKRPFRVHVSTEGDRSHVFNPMADIAKEQTIQDMDLNDLLLSKEHKSGLARQERDLALDIKSLEWWSNVRLVRNTEKEVELRE